MHFFVQIGDHGRVLVFPGQHDGRVTGQQLLQAENNDRDEKHRRYQGDQSLEEVAEHKSGTRSFRADAAGRRSGRLFKLQSLHAHQAIRYGANAREFFVVSP